MTDGSEANCLKCRREDTKTAPWLSLRNYYYGSNDNGGVDRRQNLGQAVSPVALGAAGQPAQPASASRTVIDTRTRFMIATEYPVCQRKSIRRSGCATVRLAGVTMVICLVTGKIAG